MGNKIKPGLVATPLIAGDRGRRVSEFRLVSSRAARVTKRNPVSKGKQTNKKRRDYYRCNF